jgi:putative transposase
VSGEFLRCGARAPTQEIVEFIDAHRDEFGVEPICTVLCAAGVSVAPSSYYDAKTRSPSARAPRDAVLGPVLRQLWADNYCVYGSASCGKPHVGPATTSDATRWPG